jgi:hypothetical protein
MESIVSTLPGHPPRCEWPRSVRARAIRGRRVGQRAPAPRCTQTRYVDAALASQLPTCTYAMITGRPSAKHGIQGLRVVDRHPIHQSHDFIQHREFGIQSPHVRPKPRLRGFQRARIPSEIGAQQCDRRRDARIGFPVGAPAQIQSQAGPETRNGGHRQRAHDPIDTEVPTLLPSHPGYIGPVLRF